MLSESTYCSDDRLRKVFANLSLDGLVRFLEDYGEQKKIVLDFSSPVLKELFIMLTEDMRILLGFKDISFVNYGNFSSASDFAWIQGNRIRTLYQTNVRKQLVNIGIPSALTQMFIDYAGCEVRVSVSDHDDSLLTETLILPTRPQQVPCAKPKNAFFRNVWVKPILGNRKNFYKQPMSSFAFDVHN